MSIIGDFLFGTLDSPKIVQYGISANLVGDCGMEFEAMINIKYKSVANKVKRKATQLLPDANDYVQ